MKTSLSRSTEKGAAAVLELEKRSQGYVLTVKDEIDVGSAPQLAAEIGRIAGDSGVLVVSLLDCKFIDSSGLAVLVKHGRTLGKRFRVVVSNESYLRRLFDATGLSKALHVDATVEAAFLVGGAAPA
jgi:anti-anti-sigma factor